LDDIILKRLFKTIFKGEYKVFDDLIQYNEKFNHYNKYFIESHFYRNYDYSRMPRPIGSFLIGVTTCILSGLIFLTFGNSLYTTIAIAFGFMHLGFAVFFKFYETVIDHFKVNVKPKINLQECILYHSYQFKEAEFNKISVKTTAKRVWERAYIFGLPVFIIVSIILYALFLKWSYFLLVTYFIILLLVAYLHDSYIFLSDLINKKKDDFPNFYVLRELLKDLMDGYYYDMENILLRNVNRDHIKIHAKSNQGIILLFFLTNLGLQRYKDAKDYFNYINKEECDERIKLIYVYCLQCLGQYDNSIQIQ
jgi:hypothetical protein